MNSVSADISKSLRLAAQNPLDSKTYFLTLADLIDLGEDNNLAYTYYEGMKVYCLESNKFYFWKEIGFGEEGLISSNFVYPPNTIANGIDYSTRVFNFVVATSGEVIADLFYIEPSVNIEIKDNPTEIEQAFHFGNMDIGSGLQDYALIKDSFVSQSGYPILANSTVGDEIKIFNASNQKYLGHFILTATKHNNYFVMTIVEKGDWTPEATVFNIQKVIINVLRESDYRITLVNNLINLHRGNEVVGFVDLTALLGGAVGATIVSGVLNPANGIVTFTMSDASSFDVDFSGLLTAEDYLQRNGNLAVKGSDIYQNLFVVKSLNASIGRGYYAADLTTNYTSATLAGFPYPNSRDFVLCKYNNLFYLFVRKDIAVGKRLFSDPNGVLGMSFYKYRDDNEKSMEKLGYFKILTRKQKISSLSNDFWAFPLWNEAGTFLPLAETTGIFNEGGNVEGPNENNAYCFATKIYQENIPLKRSVSAPYTLEEEDNGFVLYIIGNGAISVPALPYGFECGFVQQAEDSANISIVGASGVTINKANGKSAELAGKYKSAYLASEHFYSPAGSLPNVSNTFTLLGDLKDS